MLFYAIKLSCDLGIKNETKVSSLLLCLLIDRSQRVEREGVPEKRPTCRENGGGRRPEGGSLPQLRQLCGADERRLHDLQRL